MNRETKHKYNLPRTTKTVDAAGQSVGRLASTVAKILMGKDKADYSPQTDCGDCVEVKNVDKLRWTGNKLNSRLYRSHSRYPGNLKEIRVSSVWERNPGEVFRKTVYSMLPNNRLRAKRLLRIKFV
ncbi:50S ribosomal protein L13 [Candidatus Falkowbacteria bacterium]|nr:50S ribosomal protein L13 [Candidatus Falkowbacteria bacterium]